MNRESFEMCTWLSEGGAVIYNNFSPFNLCSPYKKNLCFWSHIFIHPQCEGDPYLQITEQLNTFSRGETRYLTNLLTLDLWRTRLQWWEV